MSRWRLRVPLAARCRAFAGHVLALLLLIAGPASLDAETPPRVADARIILHTIAGDIVLALYPDIAPRHVQQVLELTRLAVYDTTHFFAVVPDLYAQLSGHAGRSTALHPEQTAAIQPLQAEVSALPHRRGSLSMARDARDPNSALSSFAIMLADWSNGDGRYTIFGHVESGFDVLDELLKVPRDDEGRPLVRLGVLQAEVVDQAALSAGRLAPAQPVDIPTETTATTQVAGPAHLSAVSGGLLLMVLTGVMSVLCARRYPRAVVPLTLITVLVGYFLLLVLLTPIAHRHSGIAAALFLGLLSTLKLLGQFERPG